jgi:hypothetical protein
MSDKIKALEDEGEMIRDKIGQLEKDIINKEEKYVLNKLVTNVKEKKITRSMKTSLLCIEQRTKY